MPIDDSALYGGLGTIALGLLAGVAWAFMTRTQRAFGKRAVRVDGKVVAVRDHGSFAGSPTIEYLDAQGEAHVVQSTTSGSGYDVGQSVRVYYDRDAPERAIVADDLTFGRLVGAAAVVLTLVGVGCVATYVALG